MAKQRNVSSEGLNLKSPFRRILRPGPVTGLVFMNLVGAYSCTGNPGSFVKVLRFVNPKVF